MLAALEQFLSPLATVVEAHEVSLRGEWSTSTSRTYAHRSQLGTGEGPFVEVVHAHWRGVAQGPRPLAGLAFSATTEGVTWSRSERPRGPALEVSLRASALKSGTELAFTCHGAFLPRQTVPSRDRLLEVCTMREGPLVTGRLGWVVEAQGVNFGVVLLPVPAPKVARNGLWHLRDQLAVALPEPLRRLLTRGHSGFLPASTLTDHGLRHAVWLAPPDPLLTFTTAPTDPPVTRLSHESLRSRMLGRKSRNEGPKWTFHGDHAVFAERESTRTSLIRAA